MDNSSRGHGHCRLDVHTYNDMLSVNPTVCCLNCRLFALWPTLCRPLTTACHGVASGGWCKLWGGGRSNKLCFFCVRRLHVCV